MLSIHHEIIASRDAGLVRMGQCILPPQAVCVALAELLAARTSGWRTPALRNAASDKQRLNISFLADRNGSKSMGNDPSRLCTSQLAKGLLKLPSHWRRYAICELSDTEFTFCELADGQCVTSIAHNQCVIEFTKAHPRIVNGRKLVATWGLGPIMCATTPR
jgi:hypothetical protein